MDRVLVSLLVACLIAGSSHWADARRRPVRSVLAPAGEFVCVKRGVKCLTIRLSAFLLEGTIRFGVLL